MNHATITAKSALESLKKMASAAAICGMLCAPLAKAQSTTNSNQTPPTSAPSAGTGITNGTAPIETTLFAYRALASDAAAVAGEIVPLTDGTMLVIGTPGDAAGFAQWRTVIGQIKVLANKATVTRAQFADLGPYTPGLPLAALSLTKSHAGTFVKGTTAAFVLTVSNNGGAGPTAGPVTVTETLPSGLTMSGMAGDGWSCRPGGNTCTRNDPLPPGSAYPPITVTVNVTTDASASVANLATVAGGGSPSATATASVGAASPRIGAPLAAPLEAPPPPNSSSSASAASSSIFSTATGAIPTFIQLAQFLATAFAVNQTLTPSQGSMTDTPLINLMARHLRAYGVTVLVPSVYSPNLLLGSSLDQTILWRELQLLESARLALTADVGRYSQFLAQANFVAQNPNRYSANSVNTGLAYVGRSQSLIAAAQAIAANIDNFEASLFGAQPPQTSASQNSNTNNQTLSAGATVPATGSTQPAASTNAPNAGNQPVQPAAQTAAVQTPSSASAGNMLQQILSADLLAQRLSTNGDLDPGKVNFLSVHALESGGTQLTKSNRSGVVFTRAFFVSQRSPRRG